VYGTGAGAVPPALYSVSEVAVGVRICRHRATRTALAPSAPSDELMKLPLIARSLAKRGLDERQELQKPEHEGRRPPAAGRRAAAPRERRRIQDQAARAHEGNVRHPLAASERAPFGCGQSGSLFLVISCSRGPAVEPSWAMNGSCRIIVCVSTSERACPLSPPVESSWVLPRGQESSPAPEESLSALVGPGSAVGASWGQESSSAPAESSSARRRPGIIVGASGI
jgi:hypothetical protein